MTSTPLRRSRWTVALLGAALAAAVVPGTAAAAPAGGDGGRLPIVFVHGSSGSAAQFQSQFQRFTSNGWDQDLLFAYEYDTSGPDNTAAIAGLGPFVDAVLEETGADQVLLAAHSRGTTVSHAYLADPAHAAEVARYVNLDGRSSATPPGGVPTLAVWGEWNSPPAPRRGSVGAIGGAENLYDPDQGHTETASSARTFAAVYRFFTGSAPHTTDVLPEPPGQVTVAGRAVLFPQNQGYAGATLHRGSSTRRPGSGSAPGRRRAGCSTRPATSGRCGSTGRRPTSSR
ncbi:esterase/lipase family protein [Geodermatophilus sp. SYSU D01180]